MSTIGFNILIKSEIDELVNAVLKTIGDNKVMNTLSWVDYLPDNSTLLFDLLTANTTVSRNGDSIYGQGSITDDEKAAFCELGTELGYIGLKDYTFMTILNDPILIPYSEPWEVMDGIYSIMSDWVVQNNGVSEEIKAIETKFINIINNTRTQVISKMINEDKLYSTMALKLEGGDIYMFVL